MKKLKGAVLNIRRENGTIVLKPEQEMAMGEMLW